MQEPEVNPETGHRLATVDDTLVALLAERVQTVLLVRAFHREMHHLGIWQECHSRVCVMARLRPECEGLVAPDEDVEALIATHELEKDNQPIWIRSRLQESAR